MLLLNNRPPLRCLCYNSAVKTFLVFCPLTAFLIFLTTHMKWTTHLPPPKKGETAEKFKQPDKQSVEEESDFPLVRELKLNSNIKKFDNEEARSVGFPVKRYKIAANTNSSTKVIYLATTYFSEWNPKHYYFFHPGNATFTRYPCPINNCYVTKNPRAIHRADAVMFHVRDLEVFSFPNYRAAKQVWILYSMEPPWLEVKDMRRFNGLFNWTMSYRKNSTITMRYGFIGRTQQSVTKNPHDLGDGLKQKINKAVWFVSNCNTDSNREQYVQHLKKVYPVDVIGGCGREGCRPAESKTCYAEIAKRYKFYLAFENAICQDYVTEKLFNSLEYDMIPVTLGGARYSALTPSNSVIDAMKFATPEDLGKYLWLVSRNDSLYLSFFEWKRKYRSYLEPWMCELCEKLHGSMPSETKRDLHSWWHEEGSCLRWTTSGLKRVDEYAFPKYKLKLFE